MWRMPLPCLLGARFSILETGRAAVAADRGRAIHDRGGAADNEQRATLQALEYSYLWQQLGGEQV